VQIAAIDDETHIPEHMAIVMSIVDITEVITCYPSFEEELERSLNKDTNNTIIGKHLAMKKLKELIRLAADSEANVSIQGESGTGKELIARAIHELSNRKDGPFIAVNCSALSETLLESELFGHVKGSSTGAYKDKKGKFETAQSGKIFLDEIGDLTPYIQVKLLRVIQEKTIVPVGDNQERHIDMRIITATNKNLRQLVANGAFREDLFYRLRIFPINTVPLRDHKSDLPDLIQHFIAIFNIKTGVVRIYNYPGAGRKKGFFYIFDSYDRTLKDKKVFNCKGSCRRMVI